MAKETSLKASESDITSRSLPEQANLAIGEASSALGAMLSEVMRRGMSSGLLSIGEEVRSFAFDRVEETIEERIPELEERAGEVAKNTAETTVKDVVETEVSKVEEQTREADEKLAAQIQETEEQARAADERLAAQIVETDQHAKEADLKLAEEIQEAKERAEATIRNELRSTLQDLTDRSRRTTSRLKDQIVALEKTVSDLNEELLMERDARMQHQTEVDKLADRLADLEKPRGLSALFRKLMFWRKRK